ncbi:30S ribosomal protein S13 [candidate division TA06 bacterium]|uniref:Small ribosomal subunit protein uS13 n=1 Tax=candidate division TA06 bacterium TaxID=2250710 RepID=A0A660S6E2_UNCT6|nr:MAG: 30S ribosomal protein S13 [candidate division TA06 bacterium]
MARIAGVDLPNNKRAEIALTYIFGIGRTRATDILKKCDIDLSKRMKDLTDKELESIRKEIENNYKVEGALRQEISQDIKRLISIGCYRGIRHRKGLPVRGQRTKTNARTRKGKGKGSVKLKKKNPPKK